MLMQKSQAHFKSNVLPRLASWGTGVLVALLLWMNGLEGIFDLQVSNLQLQHLGTRFKPSPEIALLVIDDASLQLMERKVGRWPWPRSLLARLIRACDGARAVGVDILLLERDRVHAHDDEELAEALRRNQRTALAGVFVDDLVGTAPSPAAGSLQRSLIPTAGNRTFRIQKLLQQFLPPLPLFAESASRIGHVNFFPSQDHLLRSYSYALSTDQGFMPSLIAATLMADRDHPLTPDQILNADPILHPDTTKLLFYHEPFLKYSAIEILSGDRSTLPPKWAEGRIVLVGVEAQGLHDLRATPMAGRTSGIEIHATALSNWLQQTWLQTLSPWGVLLVACVFAATPLLFWNATLPVMMFRWALVLLGYVCLGIMAFYFMAFRVPWVAPCSGFLGTAAGMLVFIVRRERNLRQRIEEIESMKQMLGNMLVHDLRSPLSSLLMLVESVIPLQPQDSKSRQRLGTAITEGNRLNAMIQSLLEIQRMEAGRMQLRRTSFDWGGLVEESLGRFQERAEKLELKLERIPTDLRAEIHGDRDLLGRVLANLLDNAMAFATPKTTITCESQIQMDDPPSLLVRVSNHGPVLDASMREQVIIPFSQGTQKGRRDGRRGLGLGMAFCRLAIAAHGGSVRYISPAPNWNDGVCIEWQIHMRPPQKSPAEVTHETTT